MTRRVTEPHASFETATSAPSYARRDRQDDVNLGRDADRGMVASQSVTVSRLCVACRLDSRSRLGVSVRSRVGPRVACVRYGADGREPRRLRFRCSTRQAVWLLRSDKAYIVDDDVTRHRR